MKYDARAYNIKRARWSMEVHWYFFRLGFLDLNLAGRKLLLLPNVNNINQPTDLLPLGHFVDLFYFLLINSLYLDHCSIT